MKVPDRRSRLLTLRLTDQEYVELRSACEQQGARCLSDFARTALFRSASLDTSASLLREGFTVLADRLRDLDGRLLSLIQLMKAGEGRHD